MSVSHHLADYFDQVGVDYDLICHTLTESAFSSAQAAHVPTSNVVKAILLKDRSSHRFIIAAIPASNRLKIPWINTEFKLNLALAAESELVSLFPDCTPGAVPGFGQAYGIDVIWDDQLEHQPNLYFEAGNHEELIHISKQQFIELFHKLPHSVISLPIESYPLHDEMSVHLN